MKNNFYELHERATQAAKDYLRAESDLIEVLQHVDGSKGYRVLGYKSLFEYSTRGLGLSESVSYNLITVARKSQKIPLLQEKIRNKEINLSNARKIASVLTPQNQEKWLNAAATLSRRELEKEIAKEDPRYLVTERISYISEHRLELKIGISEELHQALLRSQELLSSQRKRAVSLEDTLVELAEFYLEKIDPVRKAERARVRASEKVADSLNSEKSEIKRADVERIHVRGEEERASSDTSDRYIPAPLKHKVYLRDQGQCAYVGQEGMRCFERKWLDVHHVVPLSKGGKTVLENLVTVCRGHHQLLHTRKENLSRDRLMKAFH